MRAVVLGGSATRGRRCVQAKQVPSQVPSKCPERRARDWCRSCCSQPNRLMENNGWAGYPNGGLQFICAALDADREPRPGIPDGPARRLSVSGKRCTRVDSRLRIRVPAFRSMLRGCRSNKRIAAGGIASEFRASAWFREAEDSQFCGSADVHAFFVECFAMERILFASWDCRRREIV